MKKISLIILLASFAGLIQAQSTPPIQVTTYIVPPYPLKFEDYESLTDKVIVTLVNTSGTAYDFNINFNMDGPNGLNINENSALSTPKHIGEYETLQLSGSDWDELNENLTVENINPPSERDFLINQRVFRPGAHTICIQIVDFYNPDDLLSAEFPNGCFTFDVIYGIVPEIIMPESEEQLTVYDPPVVNVTWMHPEMGAPFEYTVKVIDITDIVGTPSDELMNNPGMPVVYEASDISGFSDILADEPFEEGRQYAVRVTAVDPFGEAYFNNSGHSQVVNFYYGSSPLPTPDDCTDESLYEMLAHYPYDGDTIPFLEFPLTGDFNPHCYKYWELEFSASLNPAAPRTGTNKWGDGALIFLKDAFRSDPSSGVDVSLLTWEHASMFPFLDVNPSSIHRGQTYTWQASTEMRKRNGQSWTSNIPTTTFAVGMPRPKQITPKHEDTLSPGVIPFNWITGGSQQHIIPDYKLSHIQSRGSGYKILNTRLSNVHEHWVLQVFDSENSDTANLLQYKDELLDVNIDSLYHTRSREFDEGVLNSHLLKDLVTSIEIDSVGEYWWRVVWLKDPDRGDIDELTDADIYHASALRKFTILPDSAGAEVTEGSGECVSTCKAPEVTDNVAVAGLTVDQNLSIGKFTMKVTSISSSAGNQYSGEGELRVPFMNDLLVAVSFSNIQKNAAEQIFAGTVVAREDREFTTNGVSSSLGQALGMSSSEAAELDSYLSSGERLLSILDNSRAIGLPIGIDNEIDGNQFAIAITSMVFSPDSAIMEVIANVEIPAINDVGFYPLSLGATDVCFSPDGLGNSRKAFLPVDHEFDLGDGNEFRLSGMDGASSMDEVSYVEWDCNGFRCINLAAEFLFSRDIIVPDGSGGLPGPGRVSAKGIFRGCRGLNFMGMLTMDSFQFPSEAMAGYGFTVEEVWVDWSTIDNPPELTDNLPDNYNNSVLSNSNERIKKTWKGFWIKQLRLDIPEYIGNVDRRTAAAVRNLIIDDRGFTASFRVENLLAWEEEGHIDGFAFSIDTIFVDVVQNSFRSAGLSGKFGIPVAESREFIEYHASLDHSEGNTYFNFVARPEDDITIPMALAQAEIAPTSYFNLALGDITFVEFNLTGSFSISESNNSGGDPGALNLNMPRVSIENFKYNSNTGFDDENFTYSLASPQKSMSGFPISLESFNIGLGKNPTVTIQPRLTLMGKEGGFSAAAMVTLEAGFITESSGIDRVVLTDIRLDRIDLDVEVSQVSLSGYLEFYKESSFKGIRGGLAVSLPAGLSAELNAEFGASKTSETADFNTAEWYNYWYVDGLVTFGDEGITVFSGLQLYGLGGGVYHHMARNSALPAAAAITPSSSPSESSTGRPYTPEFENDLGIKFSALFGAPGGGKTYNFDVTLEAAFSDSRGMTFFGFKGNLRAMSEGLKDTDAPIMGYLSIEYHNPARGVAHVQGDIIVSVNFFDALTGVGFIEDDPGGAFMPVPSDYSGPRDNIFVQAQFYSNINSEEDYWYFNMGSPYNPGGLSLGVKDMELMTLKSYIMIGHEVPTTIPPPSAEFLAIYRDAVDGKFRPSGGDVNSLIDGQPRPSLSTGKGFAIGSSLYINLSANPIPFYFEIAMAIGFDINMTEAVREPCGNPLKIPGQNGFYARGQFYAGIRGEFGLGVDMWFIHGKFPIFEGAAALILQGGLPNPAWATGEGAFSYRILDGMFKGSYYFKATIGEPCEDRSGIPPGLADIQIIQDLKPSRGNDNSVFSSCTAAFAIPLGEMLEIPGENAESPPRYFEPFISSWTLKENNRTNVACENPELTDENVAAVMITVNALEEYTSYTQKIVVKVWEHYGSGRKEVLRDQNTNSDWQEDKTAVFGTGKAPTEIVDENLQFTYPFKNQRLFLKGETQSNFGYLRQLAGTPNLFPSYGSEFNEYSYEVRFIKMGEEDVSYQTPLLVEDNHRLLKFDVSGLENGEYYSIQFLRIENNADGGNMLDLSNINSNRQPLLHDLQMQSHSAQLMTGLNVVTSDIIKKRSLPGPIVQNPNEKILYHYYFKTSDYNTFKQKVQTSEWEVDNYSSNWQYFDVSTTLIETLEYFDRNGYEKDTGAKFVVSPLVNLGVQLPSGEFSTGNDYPVNSYYQYKVVPNILAPTATIQRNLRNYMIVWRRNALDYSQSVSFKSKSFFQSRLSESEISRVINPSDVSSGAATGNIVSAGNSFGNISGLSGSGSTITNVYNETVQIHHGLGQMGKIDFTLLKTNLIQTLYKKLQLPNLLGVPIPVESSNPNHYVNVYRSAHPGTMQRSITVSEFLNEFSPSTASLMASIISRPVSVMNYSYTTRRSFGLFNRGHTPPHSFILQYRYPGPTPSSRNKATMLNGTSHQVKFYNN